MADDIATLGLAVDSSGPAQAVPYLDRLAAAGKRAEDATARLSTGSTDASNKLRKMGQAVSALDGPLGGVASRLRSTAQLIRETSIATVLMTTALGAAVLAAQRFLMGFADTWSDLNARIGLAIGNMEASAAVMDRLSTVARRTYSSLEATAESFLRNATTLRELGRTTAEQLDFTEALNNALVVSGAKSERAIMVQEALGRAMAVGALRGQELNTVIQTGGRVAEVIAEQLGVGVNQLRNLGMQGKITGDVIYEALTKRLITLREEAERMPATIGDAFTLLRNSALQVVGVYDQTGRLSESLALAIISLADNLNVLVQAATIAVLVFGGRLAGAFATTAAASAQYYHAIATGSAVVIGSATAEKQRAAEIMKSTGLTANAALAKQKDIQATISQLEVTVALAAAQRAEATTQVDVERARRAGIASRMALRNAELQLIDAKLAAAAADKAATAAEMAYQQAAAKTTIVARASAVATGGLTLAMRGLNAALTLVGGPVGLLFTVITALWIFKDRSLEIGNTTISVGNILDAVWTTVKESVMSVVRTIGSLGSSLWSLANGRWREAANTAKSAWDELGNSIDRVRESWDKINVSRFSFAANMPAGIQMPITGGAGVRDPNAGKDLSDYDKLIEQIKKRTDAMRIEAATFNMSEAAAMRYKVMTELLAEAKKADLDITPALIDKHKELAGAISSVTAQLEGLKVIEDIRTPYEVFSDEMERLNSLLRDGALSWEQYERAAAKAAENAGLAWHQTADTIMGAIVAVAKSSGESNKTMSKIAQAAGIAQAIVNTHVGITKALASAAPPWNFALAAAVAAQGFASVAAIRSQSASVSSISVPSAPSSSTSIPSVPTASNDNTKSGQAVYINIEGEKVGYRELEELIRRINEVGADGGPITIRQSAGWE